MMRWAGLVLLLGACGDDPASDPLVGTWTVQADDPDCLDGMTFRADGRFATETICALQGTGALALMGVYGDWDQAIGGSGVDLWPDETTCPDLSNAGGRTLEYAISAGRDRLTVVSDTGAVIFERCTECGDEASVEGGAVVRFGCLFDDGTFEAEERQPIPGA